jgi:ligand-binding sensor domain-containing protein
LVRGLLISNVRTSFLLLCALVWCACVAAKTAAAGQFRFDSWTTDSGLPQVSVNSILQTRDGFLWLTTYGGLVRYDGLRFQVFNTGNTKGLRTSRLIGLFEDREGNLWITTEGQGLTRYKDGDFTSSTTADGLARGDVSYIYQDREFKDEAFTSYASATGMVGREVFCIYEDRQHQLWLGTDAGLVSYKDGALHTLRGAGRESERHRARPPRGRRRRAVDRDL